MTGVQAQTQRKVGELFDYLADRPEGATIPQITADLNWKPPVLKQITRLLREFLGETDEINLICDPPVSPGPWTYKLVGNLEASREWHTFQLRYLETRIKTSKSVAASLVKATDGRYTEGRKARAIERHLGRLLEDLADIEVSLDHR